MRNQFLIGLSFAAIAAFSFTQYSVEFDLIAVGNAAELGYAPQVSNEREIKVTATLLSSQNSAGTLEFEVAMETHTKSLSDDMTKSATLIAGGKQYLPSGWDGAPPGGHHRKGKLLFKAITPRPASVELQIHLIDDPTPRSFPWVLK